MPSETVLPILYCTRNMRRLRLTFVVFAILVLIAAGGIIYLWHIGGQILGDSASRATTTTGKRRAAAANPGFLPPPIYRLEDISVSASDSQTALYDYSRAVGGIMSVYGDKAIENELTLIVKAIEESDSASAAAAAGKLAAASARYSGTALRLKNLIVPPGVARVHLNLINSFIGLAESSYLMARIETEPVLALESAQIYPTRLKNFFIAANNLNFFLLASNVVLPETERSVISLGL